MHRCPNSFLPRAVLPLVLAVLICTVTPAFHLVQAGASAACIGSEVCATSSSTSEVNGVMHCCPGLGFEAPSCVNSQCTCSAPVSCTVAVWPVAATILNVSQSMNQNQGSMTIGGTGLTGLTDFLNGGFISTTLITTSDGTGTFYNTGMFSMTGQSSCSDTQLLSQNKGVLNTANCDDSEDYNYCARGRFSLNAQQTSQTWC
jgi:hypothetical protein